MNQPTSGVAFTWSDDGDMRSDFDARRRVSAQLDIDAEWATLNQIHGAEVHRVSRPGIVGDGDALVTTSRGLPLAVFTADCLGVVFTAPGAVGVAHAGWRGLQGGVLEATAAHMASLGFDTVTAHVGPAIGPCCFEVGEEVAVPTSIDFGSIEVGEEVASAFSEDLAVTTWGTTSVDMVSAAQRRLGFEVVADGRCSRCGGGLSHRRDGTTSRMAAVGWLS